MKVGTVFIFLSIIALNLYANTASEELDSRHIEDVSTEKGKSYNQTALRVLFSNAPFMRECAPPGGPLADNFTFYIVVSPQGKVNELIVSPEHKTSLCFKRHVMTKTFPTPEKEFVIKEKLVFRR